MNFTLEPVLACPEMDSSSCWGLHSIDHSMLRLSQIECWFRELFFGVQRKMFDRKGKARNSKVAVLNVRAARWTSVISERVCVVCRCENSGLGSGGLGWGALVPPTVS